MCEDSQIAITLTVFRRRYAASVGVPGRTCVKIYDSKESESDVLTDIEIKCCQRHLPGTSGVMQGSVSFCCHAFEPQILSQCRIRTT